MFVQQVADHFSSRGLAVVTGAAGGLGFSFAKKLAEAGHPLLLVDRREKPLIEACEGLSATYGVQVDPYVADFCERQQVEQLATDLSGRSEIDYLVNNAGFGTLNHFIDTDPRLIAGMVDVHVVAPMMLTHAVLPRMLARNSGAIINVSSISAWFHSAGNTHYGSTKICLAVFTAALREELRDTKIRVQALCPGFVRTQFHDAECMKRFHSLLPSASMWACADDVAAFSLRRLSSRQVIAIPGICYRIIGRLAQMPLLQPLMQRVTRVPRLPPTPTIAQPLKEATVSDHLLGQGGMN